MSNKTVKGHYCAPSRHRKGGESCYTKDQLVTIAKAYNEQYSSAISTSGTKEQLWSAIERRMDKCDNEWCWIDQIKDNTLFGQDLATAFRPVRPPGKYQWLSTSDIRDVLKQYERAYEDFVFLGPVPMDFCNLAGNEVCNINLSRSRSNGKTKIGIVFNTDPSDQPGKHWISMFIDISDNDPSKWEIGYFDSYGEAPLSKEVQELITNLKRQNPQFNLRLNCRDRDTDKKWCTTTVRHQLNNSECGVYSINFIVERLTGKPWKKIVTSIERDEQMVEKRRTFFRPMVGSAHKN